MAYAAISETLKSESETQSIETLLLRFLYRERILVSEKIFMEKDEPGMTAMVKNNVHRIVSYQNLMSTRVGFQLIPDDHSGQVACTTAELETFEKYYSAESIGEAVLKAFNGKPRKIPHQPLIDFLQYNVPSSFKGTGLEFLEEVFDIDTGLILEPAIGYLLVRLHILKKKGDKDFSQDSMLPSKSTRPFGPKDGKVPKVTNLKSQVQVEIVEPIKLLVTPKANVPRQERVVPPPKTQKCKCNIL
jgi:hypothetical protein